jgi:hypothetical protein
LAELTVQNAPDMAAAHQALGAARHIAPPTGRRRGGVRKSSVAESKTRCGKTRMGRFAAGLGKNRCRSGDIP